MISFFQFAEWVAVVTALIYVYLASKGRRNCFIYGLISSALFVYICFYEKLYFDTAINVYYIVMSGVGWYSWSGATRQFEVVRMDRRKLAFLVAGSWMLSLLLGYLTAVYTDGDLTYVDAFTTVFAALATWMMVRQILENWLLWIVVNSVSVFMYGYKDHWPIAGLFFIYTVISFYGLINWKKHLKLPA